MRFVVPIIVFLSLFIGISCESPTVLDKPLTESHPGIIRTVPNARTFASDVQGQWKLSYVGVSNAPYTSWQWESSTSCSLNGVWLYFNPDYGSGYAEYTMTNVFPCSGITYSWQNLHSDFYNGGIALETWGNQSGESLHYSLGTSGVVLQRFVGTIGIGRNYEITFNSAKTTMYWTEPDLPSGQYREVVWVRAPNDPNRPSVP